MDKTSLWASAHRTIHRIFEMLLPAKGLTKRPEQIQLSHEMLDTMLRGQIALCDAGTGIGKTYAYLAAGAAFLQYRRSAGLEFQPLLISSSSIALQHAIKQEYLPLLSVALLEDELIETPILAVIRKGKSHYVCDLRLKRRAQRLGAEKASELQPLWDTVDMDSVEHLSDYDKKQICVPESCQCGEGRCRYQNFLDACETDMFSVQICNHNLMLADAIHRGSGRTPIFPDCCALVIDEAHKLPETARQMFGVTLDMEELEEIVDGLRREHYILAAEYLSDALEPLLKALKLPPSERRIFSDYEKLLVSPAHVLELIQRQLCRQVSPVLRRGLGHVLADIELLLTENPELIRYARLSNSGGTVLCVTVSNLAGQLKNVLRRQPQGIILTSGTLAVGQDFSRFRTETGLLHNGRVTESITKSPFDYQANCLLYLPEYPPRLQNDELYYNTLTRELRRLLEAARGHALVLFTSYAAMSAVQERLAKSPLWYPVHMLGRSSGYEEFKTHPGGVLLAAGPAWEGMDFPGDCVSLLVIPRLPFAVPDELRRAEQKSYRSLIDYIHAVTVPDMQIKLRQGFGRAIRTETDTCVVAILDARAKPGQRYHHATMEALPELPVTSSLEEVERFILERKPDQYFKEIGHGRKNDTESEH